MTTFGRENQSDLGMPETEVEMLEYGLRHSVWMALYFAQKLKRDALVDQFWIILRAEHAAARLK